MIGKVETTPCSEHGTLEVPLSGPEMKITHTAVRVLFDDLGSHEAKERELLRAILDKLPDEHVMRLIEL